MGRRIRRTLREYVELYATMTQDHENKMLELAYVRETERLKHEWEKERIEMRYYFQQQLEKPVQRFK